MTTTKKIMLVVFATMLVINLQFSTPITKGMDNGFSLEQLAENIFVPNAYATWPEIHYDVISCVWPYNGWACGPTMFYTYGCDQGDPSWGC